MTEPVAYLCENAVGHKYFRWKKPISIYKPIALYTAPPKKEWVGLTDTEVGTLTVFAGLYHIEVPVLADFVRAIEAEVRGKNT
jgi:hypothetical protein